MAIAVIMPRQGQSVESCIITTWNKKVGDSVEKGDILFSYETDKSSFDEPAPESGKILAIFHEEGDDVPCLENVCVIGQDGEDFSAFAPKSDDAPAAAPAAQAEAAPAAPAATEAPVAEAPAAEAPAATAEEGMAPELVGTTAAAPRRRGRKPGSKNKKGTAAAAPKRSTTRVAKRIPRAPETAKAFLAVAIGEDLPVYLL